MVVTMSRSVIFLGVCDSVTSYVVMIWHAVSLLSLLALYSLANIMGGVVYTGGSVKQAIRGEEEPNAEMDINQDDDECTGKIIMPK